MGGRKEMSPDNSIRRKSEVGKSSACKLAPVGVEIDV